MTKKKRWRMGQDPILSAFQLSEWIQPPTSPPPYSIGSLNQPWCFLSTAGSEQEALIQTNSCVLSRLEELT